MFLSQQQKNLELNNYLNISMPPNIGEPIKNANVTAKPRIIPTMINRLFIESQSFQEG
jgi:hypothetical protein